MNIKESSELKVVNNQTGEVIEERTNRTLSWGSEPSFVKLYLNDIVYLSDLPLSNAAVLHELLKRATFASEKSEMQIIVNKYVKEQIQKNLNYKSLGTVENAITQLVKGKILFRVDRGTYKLNPYFFGKGDWQDIARLRLQIDYSEIQGKTFKTVCEYKTTEKQDQMTLAQLAQI